MQTVKKIPTLFICFSLPAFSQPGLAQMVNGAFGQSAGQTVGQVTVPQVPSMAQTLPLQSFTLSNILPTLKSLSKINAPESIELHQPHRIKTDKALFLLPDKNIRAVESDLVPIGNNNKAQSLLTQIGNVFTKDKDDQNAQPDFKKVDELFTGQKPRGEIPIESILLKTPFTKDIFPTDRAFQQLIRLKTGEYLYIDHAIGIPKDAEYYRLFIGKPGHMQQIEITDIEEAGGTRTFKTSLGTLYSPCPWKQEKIKWNEIIAEDIGYNKEIIASLGIYSTTNS